MKTTNYEISKKLAEAGFKSEHDFSWYKNESGKKLLNYGRCWTVTFQDSEERILDYYEFCFPAYVLETILEALPKSLDQRNGFDIGLRVWWADGANWIGYQNFSGFIIVEDVRENESLADTVAKMWLKLKENNLI